MALETIIIMKNALTLILIISSLALMACASPEKETALIKQADLRPINFCQQLESISGHTVTSVKQRFGEASQEKSETLISPHDENYINQRVILRYQDGYISIFEVPNYNRSYLEAVRYTLKFSPAELKYVLGSHETYLTQLMGEPAQTTNISSSYHCDSESEKQVTFELSENKIAAIVLTNWID